jgi:hypothetical protein
MRYGFRWAVGLLIACLLAACFWEDDSPSYPSIDKDKLAGCWVYAKPHEVGFECIEACYSSKNLYYSRYSSGELPSGKMGFAEDSGSYSVEGNTIHLAVRIIDNIHEPDTTILKSQDAYTIMHDSLYSITNQGNQLNPYARANSSNTCGPHWQIFTKPEGWDLN